MLNSPPLSLGENPHLPSHQDNSHRPLVPLSPLCPEPRAPTADNQRGAAGAQPQPSCLSCHGGGARWQPPHKLFPGPCIHCAVTAPESCPRRNATRDDGQLSSHIRVAGVTLTTKLLAGCKSIPGVNRTELEESRAVGRNLQRSSGPTA